MHMAYIQQARVQGGAQVAWAPLEIEKQKKKKKKKKKRLSDFGPLPLRIPGHAPVQHVSFIQYNNGYVLEWLLLISPKRTYYHRTKV